jgi:hypothetical protein
MEYAAWVLKLVLKWDHLFQEIKRYQQQQKVTILTAQMSEMLINRDNIFE